MEHFFPWLCYLQHVVKINCLTGISVYTMKPKPRATNKDARIGVLLRAARCEMGLSQESLACKVNLTTQQIQKYEKGKDRIAASRLHEFAEALDKPIIYFFDRNEDREGSLTLYTLQESLLLDCYRKLSFKQQKGLLDFVQSMLARLENLSSENENNT